MLVPTSRMLAIVPTPGFCRSGIHSSSTRKPTMLVTQPMPMPVWIDRPCAKTVHGSTPRPGLDGQRAAGAVEDETDEELEHATSHGTIQSHNWTRTMQSNCRYSGSMDSRISARALSAALGGWRTREPAYEALADGIRLLCLDNRLAPRTALPAERELVGGAPRESQHRRRRLPQPARHRAHREHARLGQRHAAAAAPGSRARSDERRGQSTCSRPVRPPGPDSPGVIADVALVGGDARLADRLRRARADRAARSDRRAVLAARHPDLAA